MLITVAWTVWRMVANLKTLAAAVQSLAAPEAGAPPEDDPGDEGSAEAHEA